ncbi:uncharacterized protein LOC144543849 [Carex rostrata]
MLEEMNRLFPQSPKLWQDWIGDEISLNQGDEAFAEIDKLYERAVQEYLSVPLGHDYINFVQEHDESVLQCSPSGATKMRELLKRAIIVAGFHVTEESKIWEAYKDYDQLLHLTIDEKNTEEKAKQNQRIRSLFHCQLAVPLTNIKATLTNYKAWEADQGNSNDTDNELDGVPPNIALNYQNASAPYKARRRYEDQLSSPVQSEADKLQHFRNYIKFESSGDHTRVQILYERAISEFAGSSDLWLAYTNYLDRTLKVASILKSVYYRATRNCSWISKLWIRYLLSLEQTNSYEEEIKSVFEQSLQCAFQTAKELGQQNSDDLALQFSDFDFQLVHQTFMDASDSLLVQICPKVLLSLLKYWAKLEINLGKDIISARGVWDNLIKKSGSTLESYEGYIAMEVAMGNLNDARAIYKGCYDKMLAGTGSEVTTRLNDVMLFKAQQESKGKIDHSSVSVKEISRSPLKRKTKQKSSAKAQPPPKKRKPNAPKIEEKPQPDHGRVEVDSGKQLEKEEESKEIEKPKPESYNDQCMAFVSSLNLRTKEEDLKSFFSDRGSVTAVQLVRDKVIGKSRVSSSRRHIDFPDHLLHKKILPRLPFKYLNRLKCISKGLHSLISTDAKFAADQSRSADTSSSGFVYMSLDGVLSFFPDPTLIGVPDPSLNFLKPTSSDDEIYLLSCTNGLLLLDGEFSHKASLCVCNPATKEMVFVPKSVGWTKPLIYKTGLAYDPCDLPDRFTIVHPHYNINVYQFNVFSSDTGKWTRSSMSVCVGEYSPTLKAVCAKGVIYWNCREYLLWYDTKRDLAGSLMRPLMKPLIEKFHIGVYAGEITCCLTWVGGIKVWKLTGGSCWDRLHATSWDGMLDALNFCEGMQLCRESQYEMFFRQHIIFPVGFDGQFVYITVRLRKDKMDKSRLFRWETETGRIEERSPITIGEPWYSNKIFKYANSMARVPQILKEIS